MADVQILTDYVNLIIAQFGCFGNRGIGVDVARDRAAGIAGSGSYRLAIHRHRGGGLVK